MVVYTWWCWHIYKGEEVGVDVDQLGDETEERRGHCEGPDAGLGKTGATDQWQQLSVWSWSCDRMLARRVTGCAGPVSGQ